jgi:hypothetical protein
MPITRTPMIDDDGSGTTGTIINNAWKQELYDQIDGIAAVGNWTPVDASGAGLVLDATGIYVATSSAILVWGSVQFPATTNTANALLDGLPFSAGLINAGGFTTYGLASTVHIPAFTTQIFLLNASGSQRTNLEMSGALWIFAGQYVRA